MKKLILAATGLLVFTMLNAQTLDEIVKKYEELADEMHWNSIIYNLDIKFKPVVGNIYYLYNENEKYTLSMIAPWEWKKEFVAKFKFDYNGKWNKIT